MDAPRRILLVRLSHLGDVVHSLPLARALSRAHPDAELGWVVQPEFAGLLEGAPGVDRVLRFDRRGGLRAWWRARKELRAWSPDWAIDSQGNGKSASLLFASGAPVRFGYSKADWREPWFHRFVTHSAAPAYGRHAMDKVAVLSERVAPGEALEFDLGTREEELATGAQALGEHAPAGDSPLVVAHLGVQGDRRSWPTEHWRELLAGLSAAKRRVLVLSGPAEEELGRDLAATCDLPGVSHWIGQGGLRPLAACLTAAARSGATFLGTDSGPSHLAAACGLPVTMLSGPQDPALTGPWPKPALEGSPHRILRADPNTLTPMEELAPGAVLEALLA